MAQELRQTGAVLHRPVQVLDLDRRAPKLLAGRLEARGVETDVARVLEDGQHFRQVAPFAGNRQVPLELLSQCPVPEPRKPAAQALEIYAGQAWQRRTHSALYQGQEPHGGGGSVRRVATRRRQLVEDTVRLAPEAGAKEGSDVPVDGVLSALGARLQERKQPLPVGLT